MRRTAWSRQVMVLVGCSLCIGLAFGIASIDARTPPDHGIVKPDDFLIHLPFWPGTGSHLDYYSYGACDPVNEKFHCGPDYYAIDFHLNGGTVYPIASGTVIWKRWIDDYGNVVLIEHTPEFDDYVSLYAHLDSISVTQGQNVDITTPIGVEGNTGTATRHLHFALRYCPNAQVGQWPSNCTAVVPEPILGEEVYEGLGWWHDLNPHTPVVAKRRPLGDSLPPTGNWGSEATGDGEEITFGSPIVFDVNYSDDDEVGEIRLTMYYENWAEPNDLLDFDPNKVWRIIARCDPQRGGCGSDDWQLEWNPCFSGKGPVDDGLLPVPWLPKAADPPCDSNGPVTACISFDIFDRAGNPLYAPAGTRCSFGQVASASTGIMESQDNQARFITILPKGFSQPDHATFVSDVTIPDGTVLSPGQSFTKIWLMRNSGTSTWDSGYQLVFTGGNQIGAPGAVSVPTTAPGNTAEISVSITAPSSPGTYQSNWRMRNDQGVFFGEPVWVVIVVPPPAPPPTDSVELVNCSFDETTLTPGQTLKVDFTVRNNGGNTVSTQGPDPGYVYQEGQSSDTIGHPDVPGRWRVAVEYEGRTQTKDHPYRWGLGSDLAPGETRTVSGYVTLNTIRTTDYWCALIQEQVGGTDFVGRTAITVQEPDRTGPTITSHHFEPSSPSNTGVVQVCAEAQDNPGGVGVDHIGVCINGCQYNESIWGAGGCVPWESGDPAYTLGVHDVELLPVDRNGNWGPSVRTCYTIGDRDITAPQVKNISFSPPSGSTESGTTDNVHIRVEWEDPCGETGIQSTTVFATDCTFGNPPLGSRTWSPAEFDWYVGCLPKGRYTVDVYMQDHQGNARSEFFLYQRGANDETPPTGAILVNPTPRDSWTVEYTGDALPLDSTPRWERSYSGGYESVSNGILRSGTPDTSHYNYYRQEANLSNQTGTTLEARLKVVSGQPLSSHAIGNNVAIRDDVMKVRLAFFPDGIGLAGDCDVCGEYQMDTTDDFHVYRLTLQGNTVKAYVDGILRLSGTAVEKTDRPEIWFGNDFMGAPDEGLWDYVRYHTGGAVPPPWSVEYTGDALPLDSIPRWERSESMGYEHIENGILRSRAPDPSHYNYYRQEANLFNETGTTLEARLKVVSGQPLSTDAIGNNISIFDDARKIRLAIFPDGIKLGDCDVCGEHQMDTTDDFHVYRLTLHGDTAKAYVDGVLRLSGTPVANSAWSEIWFGNDWMGGPDEGLWDYVRYYTGAAIPPSADVTSNPKVVLALAAKDVGWGVSQMNIGACNGDEEEYDLLGWEPFVPEKSITLPTGDGLKYVKVQYSDRAGNLSDWYYDTIILDTTAPSSTVSALATTQTASSFVVSWSGTDSPIDVAKFDVQYQDATSSMLREGSSDSAWTDWYTDTTLSSALFTGEYGHTYYFRTRAIDIAGNVEEYPAGDGDAYTEICFLSPDAFESDDASASAALMATTGITQAHNFHVAGDEDWFKFTISADATYIIQTGDLGSSADTYVYLYDTDATTLLNANDDYGGTLASQIEWEVPADGTYYVMVKHWNPYVGGCGTEYNIAVRLLGDLDGSCAVDVADIMQVANQWRCRLGDECYNEYYDMDKDGDIDIVDIMLVVVHWGETCD